MDTLQKHPGGRVKRPVGRLCVITLLGASLVCSTPAFAEDVPQDTQSVDPRPLSPAQIALFETPHLQNIGQAETLDYQFVREGPAGFTDTVAMHVRKIHPDGAKDLSFDFLSGAHRIEYPELDDFRSNPLLMLVLERDVVEMKQTLGLSAAYFRNHIREAFVDRTTVADTAFALNGETIPAHLLTVHPFADDQRLERLPSVQAKTYSFVLSDQVPGMIAEMRIEMPANIAQQLPAYTERMTFERVEP
jgi:hypothetical protein